MDSPTAPIATHVAITLNAVLAAIDGERPKTLCVGAGEAVGLPYGPFDPERHRTFEIGLREWVTRQTQVELGYIEQLYTFGDKGREAPAAAFAGSDAGGADRIVSVGYLALARELADIAVPDAGWRDWYWFFPWEDWREGEPPIIAARIQPALEAWIERGGDGRAARRARAAMAFGFDGGVWDEARTLERYELMYEAGLAPEAWRDRRAAGIALPRGNEPHGLEMGAPMISDHRRILATAVGRLRGKLRYRPIVFEMTPPEFTLLQLQRIIEAILGFEFHKQNFRRSIEKSGFLERTGKETQLGGGRPAALFRVNRRALAENAAAGLTLPRLRANPGS